MPTPFLNVWPRVGRFFIFIVACIYIAYTTLIVPDKGSGNIPEVVLVKALGSWGSGDLEGGRVWVKGGTRGVSLQAT